MNNPIISIVIPLYNGEPYIEQALKSVSEQTYADWECIIVDDGSTDNSVEKVRTFLRDKRFKLIQTENHGPASAQNRGVLNAKGEWIALLGCDDIWMPEKLEKLCDLINDKPDAGLVFSNGIEFNESGDIGPFYRERRKFPDGDILLRLLKCNCFWASSVMVRRQNLIEIGLFDEKVTVGEDYGAWVRILASGKPAYGVWEPLVRYRKRNNSLTTNKIKAYQDLKRIRSMFLTLDLKENQRKALSKSLIRNHRDQMLAEAKLRLIEGKPGVVELLFRAWLQMPDKLKPLSWIACLALPNGKVIVGNELARKW